MNSLEEIQAAAEKLPLDQKERLFRFLLQKLQPGEELLPPPRNFSSETIDKWIAEDEKAWKRLKP